jgi:enoyl-CoA hydratase/carnithine racemase
MSDLLVENTGPVRRLTLHRPSRRNALSPELVAALTVALREADQDATVHAIVLDGAPSSDGRATFCAGGDLGGNVAATPHFAEQHSARAGFADLLLTFHRLGTPTIAAVDGVALGGGFGLVLACDLAVVADTARLGTPEVKRGLFPMMISALLDEVLPRKAAMELMLTGGEVDGARAVELGIANHVVAAEQVLQRAFELANTIACMSPAVVALGRRAVQTQRGMSLEQKLLFLRDQLTINLQLDDAAEGVAAFMQKREPRWMGR